MRERKGCACEEVVGCYAEDDDHTQGECWPAGRYHRCTGVGRKE